MNDLDFIVRKASTVDFEQILSLQQANHSTHVSDETKESEGFVSVETDVDMLGRINDDIGIYVAEKDGKIVGYELPLSLEHAAEMPLLDPFVERFSRIEYGEKKVSDYNVVIEGQICVDKEQKGKGIAEELHKVFVGNLRGQFDLMVTEISDQNPRSLHVHTNKLGLSVIDQYSAEGRNWYVLAQDLR